MDGETLFLFQEIKYHPNSQQKSIKDYRVASDTFPATTSFLNLSTEYDSEGRVIKREKSKPTGEIEWKWSYSYE